MRGFEGVGEGEDEPEGKDTYERLVVTYVLILQILKYRVSQNYPNMYFSTIISTALKPLKMWIPKFSEILIKRQSKMPHTSQVPS